MHEIDGKDRAVPLDSVPPPEAGDPLPVVLAKDGAVILSYVAGRELTIIASFPVCHEHRFRGCDAAKLRAHPLSERGLKAHGAFEVRDSSWVREIEARDGPGKRQHFVFTFRDSVFECVATDVGIEMIREDDDTVKLMSKRLYK